MSVEPEQIVAARRAGYSDKEIADHITAIEPGIAKALAAGYSPTEVLDHIAPSAKARGKELSADNVAGSLSSGATFGTADEAAAAVRSAAPGLSNWMMKGPALERDESIGGTPKPQTVPTGGTYAERYEQNLKEIRDRMKSFGEEHPVADTAGKVTGAVATLPFMPAKLAAGGGVVANAAKGIALGAGMGGATGFGEGEGDLEHRLMSGAWGAGTGAAVGGGLGLAVPVIGAGARAIAESGPGRAVIDKVINPGLNFAADTLDKIAPKVPLRSVSAAAPEGGNVVADSTIGNVAQSIRDLAPKATNVLDQAAVRRIADALQGGGMTVEQARTKLAELGIDAMPADLSRNVGRVARTAYISPGEAPDIIDAAMLGRNRRTGGRITGDVDAAMGDSDPAVIEAQRLKGQRLAQGNKDFEGAIGSDAPYTISPQMRDLMQKAPELQEVMDRIQENAAKRGVELTPAQVAHRVKRQLALDTDAAFASGKAIDKSDVASLANSWRTALHDANPEIKAADAAWQAKTQAMDALDLGRTFMRQGIDETSDAVSAPILAQRFKAFTPEEAQSFISGAADTLKTQAQSGLRPARRVAAGIDENENLRSKLTAMLGVDKANILFNRAMAERTFAGTAQSIRGGSDTASKLLSAMDDAASGHVPTSPTSMLGKVLGGVVNAYQKGKTGNEAVRARIASMLTETDVSANAELLDRIAAQLAKANAPKTGQRAITAASTRRE